MARLPIFHVRPKIKSLSLRRRHFGMNCNDMVYLADLQHKLIEVSLLYKALSSRIDEDGERIDKIKAIIIMISNEIDEVIRVPATLYDRLPRVVNSSRTLDSFSDEEIPTNFRFRDKDQIRRLLTAFCCPQYIMSKFGHKFLTEELFLVTLFRMHYPGLSTDATYRSIFGWPYWKVSMGVILFIDFINSNWAYLIENNVSYWVPMLPYFAERIRIKLGKLECPFLPSDVENGFKVFGFIDNTVFATSRPGGGPTQDGPGAPRNIPLIQQSFYNGWKSVHGIKWQTVGLPNGMMLHAWGPASCRHNDNWTLNQSNITDILGTAQNGYDLYYVMYGDSAYYSGEYIRGRHREVGGIPLTDREKLENKMMSKCRQAIEWDYGLMGNMWKHVVFKKSLQLRKQKVSKMTLFCMLLTNSYVCLNGSQTSHYFECSPPSLEDWTKSGPKPDIEV